MKDKWYSDNRDLVKWSVLTHLAKRNAATRIFQIAYYRNDTFEGIEIDGEPVESPTEVKDHFRNIRKVEELSSDIKINVFDTFFQNRTEYLTQSLNFINSFANEHCIVFLDPDTGLESANPSLNHVLEGEVKKFWDTLKPGDVLVFYQHQTNRNGTPWMELKRMQFEKAIQAPEGSVKIAHGVKLARDVAFFYIKCNGH